MSNKGFTYPEVIVSFTILIIFFVPVLSGYKLAGRNLRHAEEYYIGGLYANRLLLAVDEMCKNNSEKPASITGGDMNSLIDGFGEEYRTDIYSYRVTIAMVEDGALALEGKTVFFSGSMTDGCEGEYNFSTEDKGLFTNGRHCLLITEVYDKNGRMIKRAVKLCA